MSGAESRGPRELRILLAAPSFGAYGGMEAFVLWLAETLRHDPRVHVRVCFKQTAGFHLDQALAAAVRPHDVLFCERASRALWQAIGWADVVHAQNASPDIALISRVLRKPLAISIHNVLRKAPRGRRLSWRWAASLAQARWFNSHYVWKTWEASPRVGSACVHPSTRQLASDVPLAERRGFVFIGRLVRGKGPDILLEAYYRAALDAEAWPLTILGDGPLRPALERRAAALGLHDVVCGFANDEEKTRVLASSRWLVAPSHWEEPFGLVAHEARGLGVPCIVTRDGGLPEAAGRDALLCEPGDISALTAQLRAASEMPVEDYRARANRTRSDWAAEIPAPSFYVDQYFSMSDRDSPTLSASLLPRS